MTCNVTRKDINEIGRIIIQLRHDLNDPRNLEARRESIEIQLGLLSARRRALQQINAGTRQGLDWEIDLKTLKIEDLDATKAEYKKWSTYMRENRDDMCSEVFKQYKARWQAYANRILQLERSI